METGHVATERASVPLAPGIAGHDQRQEDPERRGQAAIRQKMVRQILGECTGVYEVLYDGAGGHGDQSGMQEPISQTTAHTHGGSRWGVTVETIREVHLGVNGFGDAVRGVVRQEIQEAGTGARPATDRLTPARALLQYNPPSLTHT
jgi:hypothetical protein